MRPAVASSWPSSRWRTATPAPARAAPPRTGAPTPPTTAATPAPTSCSARSGRAGASRPRRRPSRRQAAGPACATAARPTATSSSPAPRSGSSSRRAPAGCSTWAAAPGALGAALKAERPGLEVFGLEGFPEAAERARERLDGVFCLDLDALDALPDDLGTFDAIIFGDVLEHLRDPARLLRTLRGALTEDGVIVCSIPNVKHWTVVMPLLVHDRWEYQDAGLLDRTHVHFFTLEEIDLMLRECGFAPQHVGVNDHSPLPAELMPLVDLVAAFGADRDEAAARLGAYQYLVVAGRA
ncbi:class I SAM-dependent methyltransferase [Svornostia abyssi]|uniref:Class I SAM-dependent methyltransferase n=1 Tax=Svornostia abyssi TaxID=2898438 RepID=A0ABY5PJB6_9ACTN|nr:class I SAM-dependent methyltransferase [Parviterribacteraceae bacterium J379]